MLVLGFAIFAPARYKKDSCKYICMLGCCFFFESQRFMNVESLPQDLIIHLFWHAFAFACIFVCIENIRTFVYVVTESFAHICDTSWAPGQVMGTTLANQLRINTSYAGFVRWTRCCHELTAGHLVWWPSSRSVMGKTVLKLECPTAFQQKAKQTFFGCLLNQPCDALRSSPKKQKTFV